MRWSVDAGARRGETRRDVARRGETRRDASKLPTATTPPRPIDAPFERRPPWTAATARFRPRRPQRPQIPLNTSSRIQIHAADTQAPTTGPEHLGGVRPKFLRRDSRRIRRLPRETARGAAQSTYRMYPNVRRRGIELCTGWPREQPHRSELDICGRTFPPASPAPVDLPRADTIFLNVIHVPLC